MQTVDSSIYLQNASLAVRTQTSNHIGTVRKVLTHEQTQSIVYEVEILIRNSPTVVVCKPLFQFSSPLSFQEFYLQTHDIKEDDKSKPMASHPFSHRIGDTVFVSFIEGDIASGGVILGTLPHSGKKLKINEDTFYYQIYNGIETQINKDGEVIFTRKGIPSNLIDINTHNKSENPPEPVFDAEDQGTFWTIQKDGSFELNDIQQQYFRMDRTEKRFKIQSNKCALEFGETSKEPESLIISVPQKTYITAGSTIFQLGTKTKAGPDSFYLETKLNGMIKAQAITISATNGVMISGAGISADAKGPCDMKSATMKFDATTSISQTSPKITISAASSWTLSTARAKIESPKVYIGNDAIELVKGLIEMIESIGLQSPIYFYGPVPNLNLAPTWAMMEALKARIRTLS